MKGKEGRKKKESRKKKKKKERQDGNKEIKDEWEGKKVNINYGKSKK